MLQLNEYPIALIVPKLQLSNNQQNTILSFCKSVKFLYSGVKKLYSRKDYHALLQHISAVFP